MKKCHDKLELLKELSTPSISDRYQSLRDEITKWLELLSEFGHKSNAINEFCKFINSTAVLGCSEILLPDNNIVSREPTKTLLK